MFKKILFIAFAIVLLFLSGCVKKEDLADLKAICLEKTDIVYNSIAKCKTISECEKKYNFYNSLKTKELISVDLAKKNFDKSVVESWKTASYMADAISQLRNNCSDPTTDNILFSMEAVRGHSRNMSDKLNTITSRQIILIKEIKKVLEDNNIELMADTELYNDYSYFIKIWNSNIESFARVSPAFYSSANNSVLMLNKFTSNYLYNNKNSENYDVKAKSAKEYYSIISRAYNHIIDYLPTEMIFFADELDYAIKTIEEEGISNLYSVFNRHFNIKFFFIDYSSLFGINGSFNSELKKSIDKLDKDFSNIKEELKNKKQNLEDKLKNLRYNKEKLYLGKYFGIIKSNIDRDYIIDYLKTKLNKRYDSIGLKYKAYNEVETSLKDIESIDEEKLLLLCKSEMNKDEENQILEEYKNNFYKSKNLDFCYYYIKTKTENNCTETIKAYNKAFSLNLKNCEDLDKIKDNIYFYMPAEIKEAYISLKEKDKKIMQIYFNNPECIDNLSIYNDFRRKYLFLTANSISKEGKNIVFAKILLWHKKSEELLKDALSCYMEKNSFIDDATIYVNSLDYNKEISFKLKIASIFDSFESSFIKNYECKKDYCYFDLYRTKSSFEIKANYKKAYDFESQNIYFENNSLFIEDNLCNIKSQNLELKKKYPVFKIYNKYSQELSYIEKKDSIIIKNADNCIKIIYNIKDAVNLNKNIEKIKNNSIYYKIKIKNNTSLLLRNIKIDTGIKAYSIKSINTDSSIKTEKTSTIKITLDLPPFVEKNIDLFLKIDSKYSYYSDIVSEIEEAIKKAESNNVPIEDLKKEIKDLDNYEIDDAIKKAGKILKELNKRINDKEEEILSEKEFNNLKERLNNAINYLKRIKSDKYIKDLIALKETIKNKDKKEAIRLIEKSKALNNFYKAFEKDLEEKKKEYTSLKKKFIVLSLDFNSEIIDKAEFYLNSYDLNSYLSLDFNKDLSNKEKILEEAIKEKKEEIDSYFEELSLLKEKTNYSLDKSRSLKEALQSKDYDYVKKYYSLALNKENLDNINKELERISKKIVKLEAYKTDYLSNIEKEPVKTIRDFDSSKFEELFLRYSLIEKDLNYMLNDLIEKSKSAIEEAESKNSNKEILYDAKKEFEKENYLKAMYNARRAMFSTPAFINEKIAIYVLIAIIIASAFFVFRKKGSKKEEKPSYYSVPKI